MGFGFITYVLPVASTICCFSFGV